MRAKGKGLPQCIYIHDYLPFNVLMYHKILHLNFCARYITLFPGASGCTAHYNEQQKEVKDMVCECLIYVQ